MPCVMFVSKISSSALKWLYGLVPANVDPDLFRYIASIGHSVLNVICLKGLGHYVVITSHCKTNST